MTTPAAAEALKLETSTPTTAADAASTTASAQPSTPQQQQQPAAAQTSVAGDQLVCQWTNCGERCVTAEQLYDHVCERHVGRKSTNNLNLTCQWGNCRTTTVKRDHITSHIRVHVPLKPHKCDFCGKAFKRPQDLKKHVKTHADDSVLLRSPEPRNQHGGPGYQPGPGKLVADLQALAATASGYYPEGALGQNAGHPFPNPGANAAAAFYSSAPQSSAYGPVYYQVNQPSNLSADYEIRKRAAYDALNEFFGEAKRRLIDPTTYYDVGARLAGLSAFGPPSVGGGGYHDYGNGGTMVASATHPPHHQYSLPLPALRTKSDLLGVDQFLDQLQTTVYESSNHLAAAGVAQAGAHYIHPQVNYRTSNSPPSHVPATTQASSSHAQAVASMTAPSTETPALTPASSVLSYTSGQSPSSVHSSTTISPTSRTNMPSMYPTLPSVSAMSDMSSAYPATSSAPATGLSSSFGNDSRRRYSGGLLQKAAPAPRETAVEAMDTTSDAGSPKQSHSRRSSTSGPPNIHGLHIQSPGPAIDPSLRSPSAQSSGSVDESESQRWLENMRTIEMLRSYIKDRLEHNDFDSESDNGEGSSNTAAAAAAAADATTSQQSEEQTDEQSLYPVLKAVREGSA